MKPNKIQYLLFDLGNVLIDIDQEGAYARLKELFRKDADLIAIDQTFLAYECGRISTDIFINSLLRQCDRKIQAIDVVEAWNSMLIGIPECRLDMLERLRSDYSVYVLSNTNALHLEWIHRYVTRVYKVDQFEEKYFDQVYYSHLIGDRKPNASVFKFIIDDSFLTPALTLYMDDVKENIDMALQLEFNTHLVKPGEEITEYLKLGGYY
jgi:glucose-1-phosphatase